MRNRRPSRFSHGGLKMRRRPLQPRKINSFDPSQFINKPKTTTPLQVIEIQHEFADFQIADALKANIAHKGYKTPTPIQDQVIPQIIEGKDVVGLANTGTGKTAAFLIPLINKIMYQPTYRVLVVAPTRELAFQIQEELQGFAYSLKIYSTLCIGGTSIERQIERLRKNPQFVIGTPGRIKDLSQRGNIKLSTFQAVVLDEVDQMLDMGFIHDIRHLIDLLPKERHSLFFSATLPDNVKSIMQSFLKNPVIISVKTGETVDAIEQDVIKLAGRSKIDVLKSMLNESEFSKVIVFGGSKWKLNKLERVLRDNGYQVAAIHGNKTQQQRLKVLDQFKKGNLQALLATDVASRGLDIKDVSHVINFDLPQTYEDYIHRIGRTGRANKSGKALTFID